METLAPIAPNIAAGLLVLLGGAALFFPKTMTVFVGILRVWNEPPLESAISQSVTRAFYAFCAFNSDAQAGAKSF